MKFHSLLSKLRGKNSKSTPKDVIVDQMLESRPLPMGREEFDEWAKRIMFGALVPMEQGLTAHDRYHGDLHIIGLELYEKLKVFVESQRFALANMLMHLGPTESHKPDAFFIHSLRKFAVNQVADTIRKELHESAKARTEAEEKAKKESENAAAKTLERANAMKATNEVKEG